MKVVGKLLEIGEVQQLSDTFKKRSFVLEYTENGQYMEYISFQLIQDFCSLLDGFQAGQEVEVSFNLKGRKWISPAGETKYFNSLQAWRINATTPGASPDVSTDSFDASSGGEASEEDDLPF